MINLLELFGGIGACTKALKRSGIDYTVVDYVEIDKYAVASYNAINGTDFKPQDITTWDKDIEADIIMHGSPCQDFSIAGNQAGGDEGSGTRSSLMYETTRIVAKLMPKYVIWENVENVLSKKHKHNFDNYIKKMDNIGFDSYYQVLNAKDYGIPQNRKRIFVVSIRKDINDHGFVFPKKKELKLKLKDMLEDDVDKKFYLSQKLINCFLYDGTGKYPRRERFIQNINRPNQNIANSITTRAGSRATYNFVKIREEKYTEFLKIRNATKKGYDIANKYDSVNFQYPNSETRRGRVGHQISQTLQTSASMGVVENNLRLRKLTPKECWRLMGFDDEDFEKAEKVNSNTQLYKQAGNSIVVNVLQCILDELLKGVE